MEKNSTVKQAVILAAGRGTRMRPLTYDIPKPMLPIKGKPILEHTIGFLPDSVEEVIIIINHLGENIKKHFGKKFLGKKIRYVQGKLTGTGGDLHCAKKFLKGKFLVLYGDDLYYKKDIAKLCQTELGILAYKVDDPSRFGALKMDKKGNLIDIIEKPKTKKYKLVNIGVFLMDKDFFKYPLVPVSEKEFGLPQTFVKMTDKKNIKVVPATHWHPVGYQEDLQKAEKILHKFIK